MTKNKMAAVWLKKLYISAQKQIKIKKKKSIIFDISWKSLAWTFI